MKVPWEYAALSLRLEIGTQTSLLCAIFSWLTPYAWYTDFFLCIMMGACEYWSVRKRWREIP